MNANTKYRDVPDWVTTITVSYTHLDVYKRQPALYSILALRGYFPEKQLELFRSIEGHMSGHPDMVHVPGVDMSTGSLGQGPVSYTHLVRPAGASCWVYADFRSTS